MLVLVLALLGLVAALMLLMMRTNVRLGPGRRDHRAGQVVVDAAAGASVPSLGPTPRVEARGEAALVSLAEVAAVDEAVPLDRELLLLVVSDARQRFLVE